MDKALERARTTGGNGRIVTGVEDLVSLKDVHL